MTDHSSRPSTGNAALPSAARRMLAPLPGGTARLERRLAAAQRGPASLARRPAIAGAAALALLVAAALPLLDFAERREARDALVARLDSAIAEAGRPGPDVRVEGARVQALPSTVADVRLYRVEPSGP